MVLRNLDTARGDQSFSEQQGGLSVTRGASALSKVGAAQLPLE
jgi:hypothetical protein